MQNLKLVPPPNVLFFRFPLINLIVINETNLILTSHQTQLAFVRSRAGSQTVSSPNVCHGKL